ncbi:MAG: hypothetical protein AB1814_06715 [Thermodesulfobacteriota bacterium]
MKFHRQDRSPESEAVEFHMDLYEGLPWAQKPAPEEAGWGRGWRIRSLLLGLLVAGLALRLVFMGLSLEHLPVTTDEAIVVLQSKQIAGGDRPLFLMAQPYQLPLGGYLMSPVVQWTPRTTLGARGLSLGVGLATFLGLWLLILRLAPPAQAWPALLLVAFPPAYLLLYQAAYPVPAYEYMMALWLLAGWLTWLMRGRRLLPALGLAAAVGLTSGLGVSVHMLGLPLWAALALAAVFMGGWRRAPLAALALALGLAVGLLPYLLAHWQHPDASGTVAGTIPLARAFQPDKFAGLHHALAGVLGAFSPTVPDLYGLVSLAQWPRFVFPAGFLVLLVSAGALCLRGLRRGTGDESWSKTVFLAAYAAAPWATAFAFLVNERADSAQHRYLLALAWCLPFLLVPLCLAARRRLRLVCGVLAAALALFNLLTAVLLMNAWTKPGFAERDGQMPDLAQVLAFMRQEKITHCFAAHWTSYRLTFLTDEKIICSQPWNERFRQWPIPYKDQVARDPRAAYVLTSPDSFDAALFAQDMAGRNITYRQTQAGRYTVFDRFIQGTSPRERRIAPAHIIPAVSHNPAQAAWLMDGDPTTMWKSGQVQQKGMWLELRLPRLLYLTRLTLHYHDFPHDRAQALKLSFRQDGKWQSIKEHIPEQLQVFEFHNHLPLYGEMLQTIRFAPVVTDALRLEIVSPLPGRYWGIAEVELFCDTRLGCPERK